MKPARLIAAVAGLFAGLLFYLAYRTDRTLSNRLLNELCGASGYLLLKQHVRQWIVVPVLIRGCLPSALWCFIAASLCGGWTLRFGRLALPLTWVWPLLNAAWETVQCFGWTDGRADWHDVTAGTVGWLAAQGLFYPARRSPEEIPAAWNWRVGVVLTGFACMGFADVWR